MCGGSPSVQKSDPEADAQRAADNATALANASTAARRRTAQKSSMLAAGARGVTGAASSVLATAYAKETLGA